jgi:hypothetical protein
MAAYAIRNIEGRTLAFDSYGYFEAFEMQKQIYFLWVEVPTLPEILILLRIIFSALELLLCF